MTASASISTAKVAGSDNADGYLDYLAALRARMAVCPGPLFRTENAAEALAEAYLGGFPEAHRQHYTCRACLTFLTRFGALVTVDNFGQTASPLWTPHGPPVPEFFAPSVARLNAVVSRLKVTAPYVRGKDEQVWGQPVTGAWQHMSCAAVGQPFAHALKTPGQREAEMVEDHGTLSRALAAYPEPVVAETVRLLETGTLARADQVLARVRWFHALHRQIDNLRGEARKNLIWLAVQAAPSGYCHIPGSVFAPLMDDVAAGRPFEVLSRAWAQRMEPLQYMRPQAPPAEGAIDRAEKAFAALGLAPALARRPALLTDVPEFVWRPPAASPPPPPGGLFDALRAEAPKWKVAQVPTPAVRVTWRTFLPKLAQARAVDVLTPTTGAYIALVTAVDPTAPPLLQWDGDPARPRNPASWYVYPNGSTAEQWGVPTATWVPCPGVIQLPPLWTGDTRFASKYGKRVVFVLAGCADSGTPGLALFPECVRGDLHEVRAVIEAHSRRGRMAEPPPGQRAAGLEYSGGDQGRSSGEIRVRLTSTLGIKEEYIVDRWE